MKKRMNSNGTSASKSQYDASSQYKPESSAG